MDISMKRSETELLVECEGRFTFADHQLFKDVLHELMTEAPAHLVFDLNNIEFVDSAGMGMWLVANEECVKKGTKIILRGIRGQVEKMVRIAKFAEFMTIE